MIERGLIEPNVEERDRLAAVFGTVPSTLLRAALRPSVDIADHRVSKIAAMPTGNFKR